MNERIKELGVQSKILQHINGMKRYNNQDKIEKFAELIVKECADVATINQFQYDAVGNYVLKHLE